MDHKTHQWRYYRDYNDEEDDEQKDKSKPRVKSYERRIEATSLILNHLSAPPEHKIKMIYELEKLKFDFC